MGDQLGDWLDVFWDEGLLKTACEASVLFANSVLL